MRRKRITVLLGLTVAALVLVSMALADGTPSGFVGRSGTRLTLDGRAWRFIAYNDYQLPSIPGAYQCGQAPDQPTLDSIMQDIADSGATVVRTWFFQSYFDLNQAGQPIPGSYAAFDRVLASAAAHGLKVIPVLTNEYPVCEPGSESKGLSFFQTGYEQPQDGYPLAFKTYAQTIAAHYASNQTIAFWQIGNELSIADSTTCSASLETQGAHAMRSFADDMANTIKGADPNHLVSLGTIGSGQCGMQGKDYSYVQAGGIDICDYHDYGDVTHSLPSDGFNRLAQRIQQCDTLNKPLVITESGIPDDVSDSGGETGTVSTATLQARAGFFAAKLTAAFSAGVSGYGLWEKQEPPNNPVYDTTGNDIYAIGPNGPGGDPTNAVTQAFAGRLFAGTPHLYFGFEDGKADGWTVTAGSASVSGSGAEAWDGFHSLAVKLSGGSASATVGSTHTTKIRARTTVLLHVYLPEAAPSSLTARLQVVTKQHHTVRGPGAQLLPGWNTISWVLPSHGVKQPLRRIALAIGDSQRWAGTVYVDGVAWYQ